MGEPSQRAPDDVELGLTQQHVDQHPNGPTEPDEEEVLWRLHGEPDEDGIYHGSTP
jgi:hypothetical protein